MHHMPFLDSGSPFERENVHVFKRSCSRTRGSLCRRRSYTPRNGSFYSLRVIARANSDGIEFARLRKERSGWNAWADDEDFGKLLRCALRGATTLYEALQIAKQSLAEWEGTA